MLGVPAIRIFGMLTSGELEGHQDQWARWRIPASAVQGAHQDVELSSKVNSSTEDDAEPRAAEDEARGGEEIIEEDEAHSGERRRQEHQKQSLNGTDAESPEVEIVQRLPRGDDGEAPTADVASDKPVQKSNSILGVVVGLVGMTFTVIGLALAAFYFLNQESQDIATNNSEPEGFNVPEVEASQETVEVAANVPEDKTLWVTVPGMERIKDAPVPDTFGEDEEALKNYVGIHLQGTGFPWQEEANVYLAGHRLGYPGTSSFLGFWDLDKVKEGDEILVMDANYKEYTYEVFRSFVADPTDVWIVEPIPGKNIVTLQTCTLPDYSQRLIVQAELVQEA